VQQPPGRDPAAFGTPPLTPTRGGGSLTAVQERASKSLALRWVAVAGLWLALLVGPPSANAVPTVTFRVQPVPIPGFPQTGNILGAGAALQTEIKISGTEYRGYPPPLEGIDLYLPTGLVVHRTGLPTCPLSGLEPLVGPRACPKGSQAGAVGKVLGEIAFGTKIVPEVATLETFYAPGGGLEFFAYGHEPAILEIISTAHYASAGDLFGDELISAIPLVETVPGAQDMSIEGISFKLGSARKSQGNTTYYYTLPSECPKGGFPTKVALHFAGLDGLAPQTVIRTDRARCPTTALETPEPPPTQVPGTGGAITAPSNSACVSRRNFVVHVVQIKGVRYRRVEAAVNGRQISVVNATRTHARIDLKGLPKGTYVLRIAATTTTGHQISGTRTYHTCVPKRTPKGKPTL
jgi:hypothetical protein